MSDQLAINLDSPQSLVRTSDPITSRLAAFGQKSREQHLYRVLLAYDGGDAMTDVEASEVSGVDRIETTRRASELRRHGLIAPEKDLEGNLRTGVLPTGRRGMLCRITPKGRNALLAGAAA